MPYSADHILHPLILTQPLQQLLYYLLINNKLGVLRQFESQLMCGRCFLQYMIVCILSKCKCDSQSICKCAYMFTKKNCATCGHPRSYTVVWNFHRDGKQRVNMNRQSIGFHSRNSFAFTQICSANINSSWTKLLVEVLNTDEVGHVLSHPQDMQLFICES